MFGCDDVDRLGWDVIEAVLDRDGFCGFRMIPVGKAEELGSRLGERGFQLDLRDVFTADRHRALQYRKRSFAKARRKGCVNWRCQPSQPATTRGAFRALWLMREWFHSPGRC